MTTLLGEILLETGQILFLVLLMMIGVDLLNVWAGGRIGALLRGSSGWRQYAVAPLIAVLPGCAGAFAATSMYIHGMISFGALAGAMLAASGDEAFVMLSLFPTQALILFPALAGAGIFFGWLTDRVIRRLGLSTGRACTNPLVHPSSEGVRHYLQEHVWKHLVRHHLWRTGLWTFGALLLVKAGLHFGDLGGFAAAHPLLLLLLAALLGLIPESGPHLVIVALFASHLIPFSVLLTSALVQDGHGLLPLLAHSLKTSLLLKGFNLFFGLLIGLGLYGIGY